MCCFVVMSFKKKKEKRKAGNHKLQLVLLFFGYLSVAGTPCVCFQLVLITCMAITPQTSFWSHALGCWVWISPSGIPPAAFPHSYSAVMWSFMDPAMPYVVKSTLAAPHRPREHRGVKKNKKKNWRQHFYSMCSPLLAPSSLHACITAPVTLVGLLFVSPRLQEANFRLIYVPFFFSIHP